MLVLFLFYIFIKNICSIDKNYQIYCTKRIKNKNVIVNKDIHKKYSEIKNISRIENKKQYHNIINKKLYDYGYNLDIIIKSISINSNSKIPSTKKDMILSLYYQLSPMKVMNKSKIRIGNNDGGYIMLNDFDIIIPKIAYSVGIGRDISWDLGMAKRGYEVYMYDHTIKKLPFENQKFHWKKIGICSKSTKAKNLKTLDELIIENGHQNNTHMILKMDAEGPEEDVILDAEDGTLKKFDQIILELHHFKENKFSKTFYKKLKNAYIKINKTHQVIHIHGNNCCGYNSIRGFLIPRLLEITFALKKKYNYKYDYSFYPSEKIDKPNTKKREQIILGFPGLIKLVNDLTNH